MSEDLEQLVAVEMLNRFCELAAFLQRADEIRPGLGATGGESIFLGASHEHPPELGTNQNGPMVDMAGFLLECVADAADAGFGEGSSGDG